MSNPWEMGGEWWQRAPEGKEVLGPVSYASGDIENRPTAMRVSGKGAATPCKKELILPTARGEGAGTKFAQPEVPARRRPGARAARPPSERSGRASSEHAGEPLPQPRGGQGVVKPIIVPSKYDGQTDLGEYLSHFDLCIAANGWEAPQAGMFLGLSLTGVARRLLTGVEPATEAGYWELRAALERRFQPPNQAEMYKALVRNRERKRDEQLQSFAEDILRLTRLAYPAADAVTVDSMSRDRFVEGLRDRRLRHWIFQSKPGSLEDAVANSLEAEAFLGSDRGDRETEVVRATSTTMAEQLLALTEEFASWKNRAQEEKSAPRRDGARKVTCFRCKKEGHYRRQCPVPASEAENKFLAAKAVMDLENPRPSGN